ncbi:MAG TPA: sigma-70 family RNA polymerase sigma factor, partial [Microlunatus sp.]|nr:sigma-70 family RNA polymerase sigma factor [Microlunatus sp.]
LRSLFMAGTATSRTALDLEPHRAALTGHCYRMRGSAVDADDAVQETMVRAWRALDRFDGRSSLRTWLYRIATNVCLDSLSSRNRRALPMDFGPASPPVAESLGEPRSEATWIQPMPDGELLPPTADPADLAVQKDSVRLAFIAALQHLPPRQRVVLILREVLRWSAAEVAELLETTVASVNSALQRARATLVEIDPDAERTTGPMDDAQKTLLDDYVKAFTSYDIDALVQLLRKDATASMPPFALWLDGRDDIAAWHLGPGHACRGSRLVPLEVNGSPAFAAYKLDPDGSHLPFSVQVLDLDGDRIGRITYFLDTSLFDRFGLPPQL